MINAPFPLLPARPPTVRLLWEVLVAVMLTWGIVQVSNLGIAPASTAKLPIKPTEGVRSRWLIGPVDVEVPDFVLVAFQDGVIGGYREPAGAGVVVGVVGAVVPWFPCRSPGR